MHFCKDTYLLSYFTSMYVYEGLNNYCAVQGLII